MRRQVFEILKRERLDTPERIERAVMHDRTVSQILDLYEELSGAIDQGEPAEQQRGGPFDFLANSNIAAHERGSCLEWTCRLQRIERLGRFAALWADSIVLPSYFARCPEAVSTGDETSFRYAAVGNLSVLLAVDPLVQAGIVRFVKRSYHLCHVCGRKFSDELRAAQVGAATAIRRLHRTLLDEATVSFRSYPYGPLRDRFCVGIEGPEEIIPHGGVFFHGPEPPHWLPTQVGRVARQGQPVHYLVPRSRMRRVSQVTHLLDTVADDIVTQHVMSTVFGTRYLTDRRVDAEFLQALGGNPEHERLNRVLGQYLSYQMPIIESVSLPDLLRVRHEDHEAFLVYRDTVNRVINEHVAAGQRLTGREAKQVFEDIVRPNLNKLDAKVATIRKVAARKLGRDVAVTGTVLFAGVFSGLVPIEIVKLLSAFGGLGLARELVNSLSSTLGTPDELRGEDFYFLWRLGRRAKRQGLS